MTEGESDTLPFEDLETVYDLLADLVDEAGPDRDALVLCKLVMLLARQIPDIDSIREAVLVARRESDSC